MQEDPSGQLSELTQGIREAARSWAAAIESEVGCALEPALSTLDELASAFRERVASLVADIARSLERLPAPTRDGLGTLARNGWYLDPELPFPTVSELAALFEARKLPEAHGWLVDWYDSRSAGIEGELCADFPTRARLLRKAFEAHRRQEFALAIPVFLAQADGMCKERTGRQLYSRSKGEGLAKWVNELGFQDSFLLAEALLSALLTPLGEAMPITAGEAERGTLSDALNRHAVLHGESLDYDTHLNSCRAISLLVCVSWILREATFEKEGVSCPSCKAPLRTGGADGTSVRCGKCGSTTHFKHLSSGVALAARLFRRARSPGRARFDVQREEGDSYHRDSARWHRLIRVIDRVRNWYYEHVTDRETGNLVRHVEEPLSNHRSRGQFEPRGRDR